MREAYGSVFLCEKSPEEGKEPGEHTEGFL